MSGAWSKGASKAVSAAPTTSSLQAAASAGGGRGSSTSSRPTSDGRGRGRGSGRGGGRRGEGGSGRSGGGGGGRGRGGGGGGRNNNNNNNNNRRGNAGAAGAGGRGTNNNNNNNNNHVRFTVKDVDLLNETGMGNTPAQRRVIRIPAREFIANRLRFLDACTEFTPHKACRWTSEDRMATIQALCSKVMELGDVSKMNHNKKQPEEPSEVEDVKSLVKNEDTRWKSKAMARQSSLIMEEEAPPETHEEIVNKARLILNKVSWTTLERMTAQLLEITNLKENETIRKECIEMMVEKAHREHHFSPMYAQLCATISKDLKPFKKELLAQCQREFETNVDEKIAKATQGITNPDEIEYHSTLIRKAYVGHMKFLGELYLRDVVKLAIMMHCLDELLKDTEHEDSLECFAHLMTTMGEKLDAHAKQNNKPFDWGKVTDIRGNSSISNRTRFLIQDLLDLKDSGWVSRRKEEKAKSIAEIHKEVAQEERAAKKDPRSSIQTTGMRRATSVSSVPVVDDDGFTEISRGSMKKIGSKLQMMALNDEDPSKPPKLPAPAAGMRRTQSQPASMTSYTVSPVAKKAMVDKTGAPSLPTAQENVATPEECANKIQNILKEYFVGGDTDDAVLSVSELIQVGKEGSVERGAKAIEGATLLVMERKEEDVTKTLVVLGRCLQEKSLEKESIAPGLNDPLEFLRDIEIDAPHAGNHLATIVAECLKLGALELKFLKEAPEYFRTDCKPAIFAVKVLKNRGDPTEEELVVVGDLMTAEDKAAFESGKAMFEAQ